MDATDPTRVVVTDANVLINLIHVDQLALLGALVGFEFVVPPEVVAEVSIPKHAARSPTLSTQATFRLWPLRARQSSKSTPSTCK